MPESGEHFSPHKLAKDGLQTKCRKCCRKLQREGRRKKPWAERLFRNLATRHKKYSDDVFDLTPQHLYDLYAKQQGRCYWFGVELTLGLGSGPAMISVDRFDNTRGYTKDNIVLACDTANRGRKDCPPEVFEQFMGQLRQAMRD